MLHDVSKIAEDHSWANPFYFSNAMLSTTTVPFSNTHFSQCTPIVIEVNFLRTSRLRSSGTAHSGWLKESSLSLYVLKPGDTRNVAIGYPDSRLAPYPRVMSSSRMYWGPLAKTRSVMNL